VSDCTSLHQISQFIVRVLEGRNVEPRPNFTYQG
jgi:hypothetical protein